MTIKLGKFSCRTYTGVPQGSCISPRLFNIYLNQLFLELKNGLNNRITIYGFADDILISSEQMDSIRTCIEIIEQWCLTYNMKLNHSKSGILVLEDRQKKYENLSVIMSIPIVNKYKYLGVWLNKNFDMKENTLHIKKSLPIFIVD